MSPVDLPLRLDGVDTHPHKPGVYLVAQGLAQPALVLEVEPPADADACLQAIGIGFHVDLFGFQAAPQALDEDIVQSAPPAIVHTDTHASGFQLVGKPHIGELRSLVGALPQCIIEHVEGERSPSCLPLEKTAAAPSEQLLFPSLDLLRAKLISRRQRGNRRFVP